MLPLRFGLQTRSRFLQEERENKFNQASLCSLMMQQILVVEIEGTKQKILYVPIRSYHCYCIYSHREANCPLNIAPTQKACKPPPHCMSPGAKQVSMTKKGRWCDHQGLVCIAVHEK